MLHDMKPFQSVAPGVIAQVGPESTVIFTRLPGLLSSNNLALNLANQSSFSATAKCRTSKFGFIAPLERDLN